MAVNESGLPSVEAAFADAAQAERAIAQLQHHGIDDARIEVEHGGTAQPGRTAAADRDTVDRMSGSWWLGWVVGGLTGLAAGAIVGGFAIGWGTPVFWGLTIGLTVAFAALGGLWGFFAGFAARSSRGGAASRRTDSARARQRSVGEPPESDRPEVPDAVRVVVRTKPGEEDTVHRILQTKGGAK